VADAGRAQHGSGDAERERPLAVDDTDTAQTVDELVDAIRAAGGTGGATP
jgi:hypothetical protein